MNEYIYLAHGGPGSGRYPLGSGERPYQKFEASRRSSSGIGGYIRSRKKKKEEEELRKKQEKIVEEKKKQQEKEQKFEANKERLVKSGKPSEVLEYQGMWSNSDLEKITKRMQAEKTIKDYKQEEIQSSMQKVDQVMHNVKTVNNWLTIGTDTYNLVASVYNATEEGKKKPLTIVQKPQSGGGQGDGKKKKK